MMRTLVARVLVSPAKVASRHLRRRQLKGIRLRIYAYLRDGFCASPRSGAGTGRACSKRPSLAIDLATDPALND
jgi:hypothetical protein